MVGGFEAKSAGDFSEPMSRKCWQEVPGEFGGVDGFRLQPHLLAREVAQVEPDVVANDDGVTDKPLNITSNRSELRRFRGHLIGDAGESLDKRGYGTAGVDHVGERVEFTAGGIEAGSPDLDDAVVFGVQPGGFEVKSDVAGHKSNMRADSLPSLRCCGAPCDGHTRSRRGMSRRAAVAAHATVERPLPARVESATRLLVSSMPVEVRIYEGVCHRRHP